MFGVVHIADSRRRSRCLMLLVILLATLFAVDPAAGGQVLATPPSPATTALRYSIPPWDVRPSYNPYNPDYVGDPFAEVLIPLAYPEPTRFGKYVLELAKSLKVSGGQITIRLRPTAKWQNGQPLTSTDVLDSFLLAGAQDNPVWGYISSITTASSKTLTVAVKSPVSAELVLYDLVQINIVPSQQYSQLIPNGLEQDILHYWALYQPLSPTNTTVAAASSSPEYKTLSAVSSALVKFTPPTFVGDGPFALDRASTTEILLKKWQGFWDANKISEPYVECFAMQDTESVPAFLDGRLDFTQGATYTDPTYNKVNSTPGRKLFGITPDVEMLGLFENNRRYPFNLLAVRQALAYVIRRKQLTQLDVGGTFSQRPPIPIPTGLPISLSHQELTKSQLDSLNAYSYDPSKAAKLLRSSGFTKKKGSWYTPRGTRFTANILVDNSLALFVNDGNAISHDLTTFGIHTTTSASSTMSALTNGTYDLAYWFIGDETADPLVDFAQTFWNDNYPPTWDGTGNCHCETEIGFSPVGTVPGLGRTILSATIAREDDTIASPSEWKRLSWDWARFFNKELPVLPLENNAIDITQSTVRYHDWPPRHSWLYTMAGGGGPRIMVFNQFGYLRLKRTVS